MERPGYLRLYGSCYSLSSPEAPAMLLRKQTSSTDVFKCTMNFNPSKVGYEAGVVLWWSEFSYCTLGVRLAQAGNPRLGTSRAPGLPNTTGVPERVVVRKMRLPGVGPGVSGHAL